MWFVDLGGQALGKVKIAIWVLDVSWSNSRCSADRAGMAVRGSCRPSDFTGLWSFTAFSTTLQLMSGDERRHLKNVKLSALAFHVRGDNMSSKSYSCVTVRRITGLICGGVGGVSCTYCRYYVGVKESEGHTSKPLNFLPLVPVGHLVVMRFSVEEIKEREAEVMELLCRWADVTGAR